MKILIAVPCMDSVAAPFAQSLATLNKVGECGISFVIGSLIYDSRNKLAAQALRDKCDYVLWLDSDMIFNPNTLERLLKDDKDVVSGLYFRRVHPYNPVLFKTLGIDEKGESQFTNYDDYPSGLFEVGGIGLGCCLMKTSVIFDVFAKYGCCFDPIGHFGEDLSFCIRAAELGHKIYCDSDIICGHVAHTIVTDELFKAIKEN